MLKHKFKYREGLKSFVNDLNVERGIVSMRVVFVPRSAEIKPLFSDLAVYFYKQPFIIFLKEKMLRGFVMRTCLFKDLSF